MLICVGLSRYLSVCHFVVITFYNYICCILEMYSAKSWSKLFMTLWSISTRTNIMLISGLTTWNYALCLDGQNTAMMQVLIILYFVIHTYRIFFYFSALIKGRYFTKLYHIISLFYTFMVFGSVYYEKLHLVYIHRKVESRSNLTVNCPRRL